LPNDHGTILKLLIPVLTPIVVIMIGQAIWVWSETSNAKETYAPKTEFEVIKEKVVRLERTQEKLIDKLDEQHKRIENQYDKLLDAIKKAHSIRGGK